jgi:hypothetical protein
MKTMKKKFYNERPSMLYTSGSQALKYKAITNLTKISYI